MKIFSKVLTAGMVGIFLFLAGCSNNLNSPTADSGSIKLSIKSVSSPSAAASSGLAKTAAVSKVTVTNIRIVIKKVKLESSIGDTMDFKFKQPFVQDLMVGSDLHEIATITVPPGSYKELEIKIDRLKSEDGAIYNDYPELQNRSILIKGFVDNDSTASFEFASAMEFEQEQKFDPPIVIDENSASTNVVLTINTDGWFLDANGNFLDPRLPENKSAIEHNIKRSIDIFEDKDHDGEKDHDDGHDGDHDNDHDSDHDD